MVVGSTQAAPSGDGEVTRGALPAPSLDVVPAAGGRDARIRHPRGEPVRVSRGGGRPELDDRSERGGPQPVTVRELTRTARDNVQQRRAEERRAEERRAAERRADRWVLPLAGYTLSAGFGESGSLWSSAHTGLDFAAAEGTPLVAVSSGVVTSTRYDGSYGNTTVLTLADGTEVWYCHQARFAASRGDQVDPGQVIGYVGSTGNSTGPHLHLEVRPDGRKPVDPAVVLARNGVAP